MARVVQREFSARQFRALLDEFELSTAELARRSGVSVSSISKWQREGRKSQTTPQVDVLWTAVAAIAAVAIASGRGEYAEQTAIEVTDRLMERVIVVPAERRELADWRALRGFVQPDLAQRAEVSTSLLSLLERGAATLTDEVADRLAAVLRVSPDEVRRAWLRTKTRP
ncbi:hypothetical protein AXK56_16320 [Tsukamurella pulmonis]|uniref:Helix-turn-helix domain-containing protein n=1 Tax=Tsukamurella pulmonis TaxID=47312 RepID=A0A1H1A6M8_9ACTN|nr:helix-turn-helix domain-containing protein [Tsukamurella pulmonis]KXO95776.1 hypothetical protein AXK56_16320 [Tsukamurella pulmonis]SDQ35317.1 Helix-turn-helix domain-containing protein [Tsukamurella pulmonis]SUQ39461.1 conjugal transfer protein TrbA [Tsukamurella pulmonis]